MRCRPAPQALTRRVRAPTRQGGFTCLQLPGDRGNGRGCDGDYGGKVGRRPGRRGEGGPRGKAGQASPGLRRLLELRQAALGSLADSQGTPAPGPPA